MIFIVRERDSERLSYTHKIFGSMKRIITFMALVLLYGAADARCVYTYHKDGAPVIIYGAPEQGETRRKAIVYPDKDNKGVPVYVESMDEASCRVSFLYEEGDLHLLGDGEPVLVVYLNVKEGEQTEVYKTPSAKYRRTVLKEKCQAFVYEKKGNCLRVRVTDKEGKLIEGWINCPDTKPDEHQGNCFSLPYPALMTCLYSDVEMTKVRYALCPDTKVGIKVRAVRLAEEGVLELEYAGEKSYCKVGDLYVDVRKDECEDENMYKAPNVSAEVARSMPYEADLVVTDANELWMQVRRGQGDRREYLWIRKSSLYECHHGSSVVDVKRKTDERTLEVEYADGTKAAVKVGGVKVRMRQNNWTYPVYSEPDTESELVGRGFARKNANVASVVLDVDGDWLKVRAFVLPGDFIEGWIPASVQETCYKAPVLP